MSGRVRAVRREPSAIVIELADGTRCTTPVWPALRVLDDEAFARWSLIGDRLVVWDAFETGLGPKIDIDEFVWQQRLAEAMSAFEARGGPALAAFETLEPRQRSLCALCWLEADLYNGGFLQFLGNWGAPVCGVAVEALREIGALRTSRIVAAMLALVDRFESDSATTALADVPGLLTESERADLAELERQYFQAPDDLARLGVRATTAA